MPLLWTAFVFPLLANDPTGTITGTVTDGSGGEVPKARVTAINIATNAARDAITNDDGDFTIALLPPGHYRVAVEKGGFRRAVLADVGLDVEQTARIDFTLQVGRPTDEVTVNDTPPIIQTDTSALGQVIDGRLVHELPLNDRNFLAFARRAARSASTAHGNSPTTSCWKAWTTTTRTLTNMSRCRPSTRFRSSKCSRAITRRNSGAAAARKSTSS